MRDIGMDRHAPTVPIVDKWKYETMKGGSKLDAKDLEWTTSIYRGLVPAKNIMKRDFAIAGALVRSSSLNTQNPSYPPQFAANFGYVNEVAAHWISSYFLCDKMRLPATVEEAILEAEERAAWDKLRYPDFHKGRKMSSTATDAFTWVTSMLSRATLIVGTGGRRRQMSFWKIWD